MGRPKKDNHPISLRLATPTYERLVEFCHETGQPQTVAIQRAIEMYIDDYNQKQEILNRDKTMKRKASVFRMP